MTGLHGPARFCQDDRTHSSLTIPVVVNMVALPMMLRQTAANQAGFVL
jgi:hypothetical protein